MFIIYKKVGMEMDQTISFNRDDCENNNFSAKVDVEFHTSPEKNISTTIVFDEVESYEDIVENLELQGYKRVDKILTNLSRSV